MYNPLTSSAFEFVELINTDSQTAGLGGLRFTQGITFAFASDQLLAPGERLVLVSDATAFASRYRGVEIGGVFLGTLVNGGERITLETTEGRLITSTEYDDDRFWPRSPDGLGFSLVLSDFEGDPDKAPSWRASSEVHGSPGTADPEPVHGGVIINEVLAHAEDPLEDALELFNANSSAVDVGGWYLSDRRDTGANLRKFRIPHDTIIPAGGFAVFYEADFGSGPLAFHLSASGGEVFLSSADFGGSLTGHVVGAKYGPEESGVAFGAYATTTGLEFTALAERSFGADLPSSVQEFRTGSGAENREALVGPLVINEIMYNPAENREEFVELYNPTTQPIPLYDSELGRGWRLRGLLDPFGVDDWEFGPGDEIPAQGFLVLVGIEAQLFRALNAVPASEPVVG